MSSLKAWFFLSVIFITGGVSGVALTVGLGSYFVHPMAPPPPTAAGMSEHWLTHLTQRLNLTPDQQTKIRPIVSDAGTKIQAVQTERAQTVAQIIDQANDQISAVLTPEQKTGLIQMNKEMEQNRDRFLPGRKHPLHAGDGGGMIPPSRLRTHPDPAPDPDIDDMDMLTNAPPNTPPGNAGVPMNP